MYTNSEDIYLDLHSKNMEKIAKALEFLEGFEYSENYYIKPFGAEIFAFFENASEDMQMKFFWILRDYHNFRPKIAEDKKIQTFVDLFLKYGCRRVAFETALIEKQIKQKTEEIIAYFISCLLDGKKEVRTSTLIFIRGSSIMSNNNIIEYILPQLEQSEKDYLKNRPLR